MTPLTLKIIGLLLQIQGGEAQAASLSSDHRGIDELLSGARQRGQQEEQSQRTKVARIIYEKLIETFGGKYGKYHGKTFTKVVCENCKSKG